MVIGGDGISNDVITLGTCFLMFVYIRADWWKSDSSVEREPQGELQVEFKFQRRSFKLSFFPFRYQSAPESFLAGYPRSVCCQSIVFLVVV